jgi:peptidoglycan/LPS O-acetylase OafA/YrhL
MVKKLRPGKNAAERANGFGALRLLLALGIVAFHSYTLSNGAVAGMIWQAQLAARLILPAFFALSGFLVAGSMARCRSSVHFMALRLVRILPALIVVVTISMLVAGPLLSKQGAMDYFTLRDSWRYLLNIAGLPQFRLPGVFEGNVRAGIFNGALWTIPLEIECYGLVALAALPLRGAMVPVALGLLAACLCISGLTHLPAPNLFLAFACGGLLHHLGGFVPRSRMLAALCLAGAFWMARNMNAPLLAFPLAYAVVCLGQCRLPAWLTRADYSYGVYLVGFPVEQTILSLHPGLAWWTTIALSLPVIFLLSALLWHLVESPLLKRRHLLLEHLRGGAPERALAAQAASFV